MRTVSVGICAADAMRLARGDEPEVGAVMVGRRRLPWAAAPTWYGGWGWGQDDLPSLRYHGQPVFASSSQLDAFAVTTGTVSRVRPIPATDEHDEHADELAAVPAHEHDEAIEHETPAESEASGEPDALDPDADHEQPDAARAARRTAPRGRGSALAGSALVPRSGDFVVLRVR